MEQRDTLLLSTTAVSCLPSPSSPLWASGLQETEADWLAAQPASQLHQCTSLCSTSDGVRRGGEKKQEGENGDDDG